MKKKIRTRKEGKEVENRSASNDHDDKLQKASYGNGEIGITTTIETKK